MSSACIITAKTPDHGLFEALWWLKTTGVINDSRNGPVVQAAGPVITAYPHPRRRVLFSQLRDANPFFHLYEAIWMLAGRDDSASVAQYASTMESFAEDGRLWGAYGYRWRHFFGFDQLQEVYRLLVKDSSTRRAVLTMWAPDGDLRAKAAIRGGELASGGGVYASKDVPCNTQVYFDGTKGALDMTVTNRSNDIVWGCYGANLVHMSVLHEFMASAIGMPLGTYYQVSNNFHMYLGRPDAERLMATQADDASTAPQGDWRVHMRPESLYDTNMEGTHYPLMDNDFAWSWLVDASAFVDDPTGRVPTLYSQSFFPQVAIPLMKAHAAYKEGELQAALRLAEGCQAWDWRVAAIGWLSRRLKAREAKAAKDAGFKGVA